MTYRDYVEQVRGAHSVRVLLAERYNTPVVQGMARCPFHADQHPSCSVTETVFHCFACHASGDVFHLVQRLEGVEFAPAVARLAEWAGLPPFRPLPADHQAVTSERDLEDATETAASYYQSRLTPEARAYLTEQRRLPSTLLTQARIGWADGGLVPAVTTRLPVDLLVAAGLALPMKNAATWSGVAEARDLLRDRIVFPALRQGRATFLSGRATLPDQTPKYLSQRGRPAPLYNQDAVGPGELYVTEGPVDALSLMAWGLPTVALLGTMHRGVVAQLRRPRRIYLCLDADTAGREGVLKVTTTGSVDTVHRELVLGSGAPLYRSVGGVIAAVGPERVRVVPLPEGLDPNDFFRAKPLEALLGLVEGAQEPVAWALGRIPYAQVEPGSLDRLLTPVFQLWASLPPATVRHYLDHPVARWAGGQKAVIRAVEASWRAFQARPLQCPGCGTFLAAPEQRL